MANIFTQIQRKVNQGKFAFLDHARDELADENFSAIEAIGVILKPFNYFVYDNDPSHKRYAFEGFVNNDRMLRVICFVSNAKVYIKTAYEIFD
ncbi:MAG: DUF4258 domain-containing protein [Aridibacter sp.]